VSSPFVGRGGAKSTILQHSAAEMLGDTRIVLTSGLLKVSAKNGSRYEYWIVCSDDVLRLNDDYDNIATWTKDQCFL
jgi:hypothetical protein